MFFKKANEEKAMFKGIQRTDINRITADTSRSGFNLSSYSAYMKAVFEKEDGTFIYLSVKEKKAESLAKNRMGVLKYKGDRLIKFTV